jgi:hypothetical protein
LKTPPLVQPRLASIRSHSRRDQRFLVFVGIALVAVALGFKTELAGGLAVWTLALSLLLLAVPSLVGYLHSPAGPAGLEHMVPVLLSSLSVAGLSTLLPGYLDYSAAASAFGVVFCAAAYLDHRRMVGLDRGAEAALQEILLALALAGCFLVLVSLNLSLPVRLAGVFGSSFLASYRSFRVVGRAMKPRRALLFSVFVAQLVGFFAWAMSVYLYFTAGVFTVLLFLLWYVNRGIIRHTAEESMSFQVVIEYGLFVLLIAYLFFTSLQPR